MLSIISPAKTMNFSQNIQLPLVSEAGNKAETKLILKGLRELSVEMIMQIMKVSRRIAKLNYERFKDFEQLPEKAALFAYNGDVYNNIDTGSFNEQNLNFAQEHLRILSAFYGLLRPLDLIKAYRLEMSTRLYGITHSAVIDEKAKPMHLFWQNIFTNQLNRILAQHKNKFLINLASQEYSAAIDLKQLKAKMINIYFRRQENGELKNIPVKAKYARGMMTDFIIRNRIDHPDELKNFQHGNYQFEHSLSDESNFYYIVPQENHDYESELD